MNYLHRILIGEKVKFGSSRTRVNLACEVLQCLKYYIQEFDTENYDESIIDLINGEQPIDIVQLSEFEYMIRAEDGYYRFKTSPTEPVFMTKYRIHIDRDVCVYCGTKLVDLNGECPVCDGNLPVNTYNDEGEK